MRDRVPDWYRDAKLGILVRWGVPSVPAYAPSGHGGFAQMLAEHGWRHCFEHNPRAEWYLNSIRIPGSPAAESHRRHYGRHATSQRLAGRFAQDLDRWSPLAWAELFAEAGARYVVMTAKDHDGYLLWPSGRPPSVPGFTAPRDVVGELGSACRARQLRYGVSYSTLLDWTVQDAPIRDFPDLLRESADPAYASYVAEHLNELIDRYSPDLLLNDIGLPAALSRPSLVSRYRETVPDGVLTGRWRPIGQVPRLLARAGLGRLPAAAARRAIVNGRPWRRSADVPTCEYGGRISSQPVPWELVRGISPSFAWNRQIAEADHLSGDELIRLLVDVVSRNGNLLLGVGPQPDGTIPREQLEPLTRLGVWLRDHREAIYGTRPWHRAEATTADGLSVRFTASRDALYVFVFGQPRMLRIELPDLDLRRVPKVRPADGRPAELVVRVFGCEQPVQWETAGAGVGVNVPGSFVPRTVNVIRFAWEPVAPDEPPVQLFTDII